MRLLMSSVVLVAAVGLARPGAAAADEAAPAAPAAMPSLPPGYIAVPTSHVRDAMLYLGGRAGSDEMAAIVFKEFADDALTLQHAAPRAVPPR